MRIGMGRTKGASFKLKRKEAIAAYLFILPSLAGFSLFFIIPFFISFYYCFTEGVGNTTFVGLKNFKDLLSSGSFLLASRNMLLFNMLSVPLIMVLSCFFAVLLNQHIKGRAAFRSFFIFPLVIPGASVILVWQIIFNESGVLNHFLSSFGVEPVDWIRSRWSVVILMLVFLWKNCGYNVILFLAGLNNIPKEYYDSARIDGAGAITCLIRITIPFLIPTAFFVFIISIINSFKVFREAYQLAGSYPEKHIYLLQHFMNNNFYNLSYPRLVTAAFLMAMLVALLVYGIFRFESSFGRNIS